MCVLQAIEALQTAIASKRSASLFTLLGKIQMKASLWKDAVTSFESSLDIMVSTNTVTMQVQVHIHYLMKVNMFEMKDSCGIISYGISC